MGISFEVVIAYAIGLLLLYFLGWLLMKPLKALMKLFINALLGGALLWLINRLGSGIGIGIPLNFLTALTAGFLGIPGVLLILLLQAIL